MPPDEREVRRLIRAELLRMLLAFGEPELTYANLCFWTFVPFLALVSLISATAGVLAGAFLAWWDLFYYA